jgi:hypothetical protein
MSFGLVKPAAAIPQRKKLELMLPLQLSGFVHPSLAKKRSLLIR